MRFTRLHAFTAALLLTITAGVIAQTTGGGFPSRPTFQAATVMSSGGNAGLIIRTTAGAANSKNVILRNGSLGTNFAISSATDAAPTVPVANLLIGTHTGTTWDDLNLTATTVRVNGSTVQSAAYQKTAYGFWTCTTSCSQIGQILNMSIVRNSVGNYTVDYTAAGFTTVRPTCTVLLSGIYGFVQSIGSSVTTNTISIRDTASNPADAGFNIICVGT